MTTSNLNEPLVFGRLKGKPGEPVRFTRTVTMEELISACCPVDRVFYQYAGPDGQPMVKEAGILVLDFIPTSSPLNPPQHLLGEPQAQVSQEALQAPSLVQPMPPPTPQEENSTLGHPEPITSNSEKRSKLLTKVLTLRKKG